MKMDGMSRPSYFDMLVCICRNKVRKKSQRKIVEKQSISKNVIFHALYIKTSKKIYEVRLFSRLEWKWK